MRARMQANAIRALALLVLLPSTAPARGDPVAIERGRIVAEGRCGRCHATGPSGASPHRIVLPFRELATRFPVEMLTDALRTGIVGGHDEMPMFDLGLDDARALIAYIDSLSPEGARYSAGSAGR